jgi:glycosyltransferase involved in cell wall biosynthesis
MIALLGIAILTWTMFLLSTSIFQYYYRKKFPHMEEIKQDESWPTVSILVPAFNEEKVLEGAVQSTLSCDYPNFDIIIIDDGSTDKTLSIAKELSEKNDKVKVVAQPYNQGKAEALNAGIRNSTSEYVVVVDADTILNKQALKLLIATIHNSKYDAVCGNVKVGNRNKFIT